MQLDNFIEGSVLSSKPCLHLCHYKLSIWPLLCSLVEFMIWYWIQYLNECNFLHLAAANEIIHDQWRCVNHLMIYYCSKFCWELFAHWVCCCAVACEADVLSHFSFFFTRCCWWYSEAAWLIGILEFFMEPLYCETTRTIRMAPSSQNFALKHLQYVYRVTRMHTHVRTHTHTTHTCIWMEKWIMIYNI